MVWFGFDFGSDSDFSEIFFFLFFDQKIGFHFYYYLDVTDMRLSASFERLYAFTLSVQFM